MKRSSKVILSIAGLLLAVAGLLLFVNSRPRPRPEELIRAALNDAASAAQKRSVGGVMQVVSEGYRDSNNLNKQRLALLLNRSYRMSRGTAYSAHVNVLRVVPDEKRPRDEALVFTTVSVFNPSTNEQYYGSNDQTVTFKMRREPGRRYLIFPDEHWRIVSVVNLPPLPGGLDDDGGGGSGGLGGLGALLGL